MMDETFYNTTVRINRNISLYFRTEKLKMLKRTLVLEISRSNVSSRAYKMVLEA